MRRLPCALLWMIAACAGAPPPGPAAPLRRAAPDGLERARAAVVATLAGLHFVPRGDDARGAISEGQGLTLPAQTGPSACTLWVAIGGEGLADLDAALYDADGRRLALDNEPDPRPVVGLCGDGRPRLYYRLQAYRGVGPFRVVRFSGPAIDPAELIRALGGQPSLARAVGSSPLDGLVLGARRHGYRLRGPVRRVHIGPELPLVLPLQVRAGTCVGAVVAGASASVAIRLLDATGQVRAVDGDGANPSRLMACPRRAGSWHLELVARGAATDAEVAWIEAEQADAGDESALPWGTRPSGSVSAR